MSSTRHIDGVENGYAYNYMKNNHTNFYNRGADGWIESVVSPIGPTLDTTFNSYGYMTELDIIPEGQSNSVGRTYTMDRGELSELM